MYLEWRGLLGLRHSVVEPPQGIIEPQHLLDWLSLLLRQTLNHHLKNPFELRHRPYPFLSTRIYRIVEYLLEPVPHGS